MATTMDQSHAVAYKMAAGGALPSLHMLLESQNSRPVMRNKKLQTPAYFAQDIEAQPLSVVVTKVEQECQTEADGSFSQKKERVSAEQSYES
eukprot:CAMPEP_0185616120 /NCGR_PEP_ID=MMETSP0436-20130131/38340_1 /TAXON_ID=626734 ORGANISM="Favella taraikaensis, Strain Fe Narragansett Bay" /NCGR_SAMPLE_ID=MMETSP0436 /ASSEMBLY_ACC=CAM_ASM_000390 /LENGTH=91 /DNA_ID=CAMNT_0028252501 /DNA_START=75 /DNA_END=350 /DNA_ORIENTATION=-